MGPGDGFGVAAEDDVGAAAGHVRGDGDGADAAGLGDDFRFTLGVFRLGVQQFVLDAAAFQHAGQLFRLATSVVPIRIGRPEP